MRWERAALAQTTGLLQYEVDTPLFEFIGLVGEKKAVRSYKLCLEAIYGIDRLVHELGDAGDFERKRSRYLASRRSDVEILQKEYSVRTRHGRRLELLGRRAVGKSFELDFPAALLSFDAGQIDAHRLTHLGAEVITRQRNRIKARRIVFTNWV